MALVKLLTSIDLVCIIALKLGDSVDFVLHVLLYIIITWVWC